MSQFDEAAENARTCAYANDSTHFDGFLCEREADHYPYPHAALLDSHAPIYWTDEGRKTDALGRTIKSKPTLVRAEVEAKIESVRATVVDFAKRGVVLDGGELIMTRVNKLTELIIGNMDDQRRLKFEDELADLYTERLSATAPEIDRAMLTHGITPSGLHLPNGGPR